MRGMVPNPRRWSRVGMRDGGSVTAETAVGLPALVVLVAFALTGVFAVTQQMRCVDAAREGARAVARGERDPTRFARAVAPEGATVRVTPHGALARVEITAPVRLGWRPMPGITARAHAVAAREPSPDQSVGVSHEPENPHP